MQKLIEKCNIIKDCIIEFFNKYPLIVLLIFLLFISLYFANKRFDSYRDGLKEILPEQCQECFLEYDNHFFNSGFGSDDYKYEF